MKSFKIAALAALGWLVLTVAPAAQSQSELALTLAFDYTGVALDPQDELKLPLTVINAGRRDESFKLSVVEKPSGWSSRFKSFSSEISGLFVPAGEAKSLYLIVSPPPGPSPAPGEYSFTVEAESLDGHLKRQARGSLVLRPGLAAAEALSLRASYPELRGPSDSRFSFSIEARSQASEDSLVGLSARVPEGWQAAFKPSYEDKQISSIQITSSQSRVLTLDLTPPFEAAAGRYPITVRAESRWGAAELDLLVELTGTYGLRIMMANELLSAAVSAGRPASLNFFVFNEGSAEQRELRFLTVAPDRWKVTFDPPVLRDLKPRQSPAAVTMTVEVPEDALVGDYGLGLLVEGERAKSAVDLRLTVRAQPLWAWLGLGLMGLTVLALGWVFRRLGRR